MALCRPMASIERRPVTGGNVHYRLVWRLGGKKAWTTFEAEQEARHWQGVFAHLGPEKAARLLDEDLHPAPAAPRTTIRDLLAGHIGELTGIQEGTRARYLQEAARDIYPHLGDVPLTALTPQAGPDIMAAWVRTLETQPLARKTIENRRGLLQGALSKALRRGLIHGDPFAGVNLPDAHEEEMTFLEPDQWWLLHDSMRTHWRPLISVLVGTGLRWGEATALRVRDVDLTRRRLKVVQAWKWHPSHTQRTLGPPKTKAGRRTVPLLDLPAQVIEPLLAGKARDDLILTNTAGTPIKYATFHPGAWTSALDDAQDAGLTVRPRIHDLRHTFASWLLANGQVSVFSLAEVLGHDDIKVTTQRYGHLMPGSLDAIEDAGNAILHRPSGLTVVKAG